MDAETRTFLAFNKVSPDIREDIERAAKWARKTLRDHEGSGHSFHLNATKDGMFQCSFAKPEWSGDHCSKPMPEAPEAIVMAVCEYLNGV